MQEDGRDQARDRRRPLASHFPFIATFSVVENAMAMMNGTQIGRCPRPGAPSASAR